MKFKKTGGGGGNIRNVDETADTQINRSLNSMHAVRDPEDFQHHGAIPTRVIERIFKEANTWTASSMMPPLCPLVSVNEVNSKLVVL